MWHRPYVYWTIPALFLLVTLVTSISLDKYSYQPSGLGGLAILLIYVIVGIPTILGAIYLLRKMFIALFFSMIALIFFGIYFWLVGFQNFYSSGLEMKIMGLPMFMMDLLMMGLVIIGCKKMF